MGLVLSDNGIGPTEDKVKAIVDAREPQSALEAFWDWQTTVRVSSRTLLQSQSHCEDKPKRVFVSSLERSRRTHSMSLRGGY